MGAERAEPYARGESGQGPKLEAAKRGDVLAFQADSVDPVSRAGWSVLVIGHATVVVYIDRLVAVVDTEHRPWVRGRGEHVIQVAGERTTGRRLVLGEVEPEPTA